MPLPSFRTKRVELPFVNRHEQQRLFQDAVQAITDTENKLLVFHGFGGEGKTALSLDLFKKATGAEPSYSHLRAARIDFKNNPPLDDLKFQIRVRQEFAKQGITFPVFDYVLALNLAANRAEEPMPTLIKPLLQTGGEAAGELLEDGVQLTRELVEDVVETIPGVRTLLRWGRRVVVDKASFEILKKRRPHINHAFDENGAVRPAHELIDLLPWLLAMDLNTYIESNPQQRLVLFLDEYEAVFGQPYNLNGWRENAFDRRVRGLLEDTRGLVVVITGREKLPWHDSEEHHHPINGLTAEHAEETLIKHPVDDATIRAAMVEAARDGATEEALVYPFLLSLQVDLWEALKAKGETPTPNDFALSGNNMVERAAELIDRVLKHFGDPVQHMLKRLAVIGRFDQDLFNHAINAFGIALSHDDFDAFSDFSFVTSGEGKWLTLHRAACEALKAGQSEERLAENREAILGHLEERLKNVPVPDITGNPKVFDDVLTSLRATIPLAKEKGAERLVSWLNEHDARLHQAGKAFELEALWRETLAFCLSSLGENHPSTATSYNNVGFNLNAQGRHEDAEPLFKKGLEIRIATLGENHPDTATSFNNVAANLNAQGRYEEAEPLYKKGLEIRIATLGENHPSTAASYNNVAANLNAKGRYEEAEPLFKKGLDISIATLGENHPDTARSYNNVAYNLDDQGRYEDAEPLYKKGLDIRIATLGENHPDTASSYNNVAANLGMQGRWTDALPLAEKAVAIAGAVLGRDHPSTQLYKRNLEHIRAQL